MQADPLRGGGVPGADGLPRGALLQPRGEGHQGQTLRVQYTSVLVYSLQSARVKVGNTPCVSRLCVSAPLAVSLVTLLYRDNVRDFLICSSSEERLRFNLRDFWLEANYQDENFGNLPPYHPFCVLLKAICKDCHPRNSMLLENNINIVIFSFWSLSFGSIWIYQNRTLLEKTTQ